jgi:hypothetical protein
MITENKFRTARIEIEAKLEDLSKRLDECAKQTRDLIAILQVVLPQVPTLLQAIADGQPPPVNNNVAYITTLDRFQHGGVGRCWASLLKC